MKTFRKLCAAALLAGVLTVPVNAGDMWTGYAPPPPPPDQTTTTNRATADTNETGDTTFDTIATLLSGLLGVL